MNPLEGESVLNLGDGGNSAFVSKATDPVISPTYSQPADFTAQYPIPLDTTEVITMCEEIGVWQALPEIRTSLNGYTFRELSSLAFTSGSSYIAFADGACPEEYTHDGNNVTVNIKNIGAKKTLSYRDIMHSAAVAAANWNGINTLVGGYAAGEGVPGGSQVPTFVREVVRDVKEKEARLAMTLVLNGWDRLLVSGDHLTNSLEFTGIENWATNYSCSFHTNANPTGTYSTTDFDRFLSESCAKPTHVFGTPQAIQEMLSGYYQLGFSGSQVINYSDGARIVPGFNFAGFVNTGVGRLAVVADQNFRRTLSTSSSFFADLWTLRMTHNGDPLVFKITQVPLSMNDLAPGCTAVSFEIWAATALVIKGCCAHGKFSAAFSGRIVTTCSSIG